MPYAEQGPRTRLSDAESQHPLPRLVAGHACVQAPRGVGGRLGSSAVRVLAMRVCGHDGMAMCPVSSCTVRFHVLACRAGLRNARQREDQPVVTTALSNDGTCAWHTDGIAQTEFMLMGYTDWGGSVSHVGSGGWAMA